MEGNGDDLAANIGAGSLMLPPAKKIRLQYTHHESKFTKKMVYNARLKKRVEGYECTLCPQTFSSRGKTAIKSHLEKRHRTVWEELEGEFHLIYKGGPLGGGAVVVSLFGWLGTPPCTMIGSTLGRWWGR